VLIARSCVALSLGRSWQPGLFHQRVEARPDYSAMCVQQVSRHLQLARKGRMHLAAQCSDRVPTGHELTEQAGEGIASGANLTFRFAEGFPAGLACASLPSAQAKEYPIERCRPPRT